MEWLYIIMPIAGVKIFWPGLIILGVGVGIIGGFLGGHRAAPITLWRGGESPVAPPACAATKAR